MPRNLLMLILIIATAPLNAQCQRVDRSIVEKGRADQTSPPSSQEAQTNAFNERLFVNARHERMPYLLFVPKDYDRLKKYPLVLWLHGGGSRGDDLKQLNVYGDQSGLGYFARADNQSKYPSFIVAPQCPLNKLWGDPDSVQPTAEMRLVLEILEKVQADYSVDSRRLYATGISLGGFGTWDVIARRPEMFAAAVPICGGGNPAKAPLMAKTPIWAFHGEQDELVNVSQSRRMIAAIRNAGGEPRYTEYKGVGHNSWERAFAEPKLLPWLFAQRR
jgi:predicted peptidase